eukprot:3913324-Prymnesium_polylepis.1
MPFAPCAAENEQSGNSDACSGVCPAGKLCSESPTLRPSECPKGHYCLEGSVGVRGPCPYSHRSW